MPPLRDINLSRNCIGDRGACSMADLLAGLYHLKIVKMSWNQIKSKGGIALAEALKDS
jgi:Ran GTPase-activating protein (RanGAP) involved in mRNA processing and transport